MKSVKPLKVIERNKGNPYKHLPTTLKGLDNFLFKCVTPQTPDIKMRLIKTIVYIVSIVYMVSKY